MENGKCYISNDDATWNDLGGTGYAMGDIGLRATIGPIDQGSECFKEGDPAFYVDFGETARDVIAGETVCWTVGPCNFGFVSATCPDTDTFCVDVEETQNWIVTGDPPLRACNVLDPGYLWWQDICVTVPCDVSVCDYDTVTAVMSYCDAAGFCAADCGDCEDPNFYGGDPYYSTITVVLHVVESPPALYILQDSLYLVEQGQTAAYIPFSICNGDACADATVYGYSITSTGTVGGGFPQTGTTDPIPGGECLDIYGVVDAGAASICDYETLTIIAWDDLTGTVYDTCVQLIHVVEPVPVPLFTTPVVTILVLAMILAAAVFMRKHAINRA